MGQVCSGAKEESTKGGLLDVPSTTSDYPDSSNEAHNHNLVANNNNTNTTDGAPTTEPPTADEPTTAASAALADLERRKRRELWIVNGAARGMVAVRSTRGSTGYYDQGFAGLLAQHLEQTTSFPDKLPLVLPPMAPLEPPATRSGDSDAQDSSSNHHPSADTASGSAPATAGAKTATTKATKHNNNGFYERLALPPWDGMEVVVPDPSSKLRGREASAAASGDPHKLMDALAESLLDGPYTVLPAKQQLFSGTKPMVENLL